MSGGGGAWLGAFIGLGQTRSAILPGGARSDHTSSGLASTSSFRRPGREGTLNALGVSWYPVWVQPASVTRFPLLPFPS